MQTINHEPICTTNTQDMLTTLQNIELLALVGRLGNSLTPLMARLLAAEIAHSETHLEALERAEVFVATVKREYQGA